MFSSPPGLEHSRPQLRSLCFPRWESLGRSSQSGVYPAKAGLLQGFEGKKKGSPQEFGGTGREKAFWRLRLFRSKVATVIIDEETVIACSNCFI